MYLNSFTYKRNVLSEACFWAFSGLALCFHVLSLLYVSVVMMKMLRAEMEVSVESSNRFCQVFQTIGVGSSRR